MDALIAFLRQQLDEDERVALAANPAPWRRITDKHWLDPNTIFGGSYMGDQEKLRNVASLEVSWIKEGNAEHITRWDPARVLAEVEAKRRVLDVILAYEAKIDGEWGCCHSAKGIEEGRCPETPPGEIHAIRLLAQPYAGRQGWREEWSV